MSGARWAEAALWTFVFAGTALGARALGRTPVRVEIGGFQGSLLDGPWSPPHRANLDPPATADGVTSFYYRAARPLSELRLPLASRQGPARVTFRARARVRSVMALYASGQWASKALVRTTPWDRYAFEVPESLVRGGRLDLSVSLRPLPLVAGDHVGQPEVLVDYVDVEAPGGLLLSWTTCLLLAGVPILAGLFGRSVGLGSPGALGVAGAAALATLVLRQVAPVPTILGAPRLVPLALLFGAGVHRALGACRAATAGDRGALAGLTAMGILVHGSVVFFPNHNPPDLQTHIERVYDLRDVPLEYEALLRYGSHMPTATQHSAPATDLFGERTLIPYSPLPNLVYFGLHSLGLDLWWGLTALNAALAMAVAPWAWVVSERLWGRGAAWVGTLLYSIDLAVWHHIGRAHAPAAFGGALGTAALLFLAARGSSLTTARATLAAGAVLGIAVLGYSSLVVLVGLFGVALLALLLLDARGLAPEARRGLALCLVVGGLLAGGLYYFHYVPGILKGAGSVEAEPEMFVGRTFLIFHNEGRQSLRIWQAGYWVGLLLGLVAAPLAMARARAEARPVLAAWLLAWALVMVLKEPFLFPKMLRWAKEDQFLSPLLCLLIGAGAWALPRRWMRATAAGAALALSLWLQARDFLTHADTLLL